MFVTSILQTDNEECVRFNPLSKLSLKRLSFSLQVFMSDEIYDIMTETYKSNKLFYWKIIYYWAQ